MSLSKTLYPLISTGYILIKEETKLSVSVERTTQIQCRSVRRDVQISFPGRTRRIR